MVPAAGLEPAQASFKGWWAANYPTPEFWQSHHAKIAAAAAVRTRYRPNRDGGIGGSRAPGVRLAVPDDAPDLGHAGRSPAFDPAVEIRTAADVNAQATAAHAIMWAVP